MAFQYEQQLTRYLAYVAQHGASDLHFTAGRFPTMRVDDVLVPIADTDILTPEDSAGLADIILIEEKQAIFRERGEVDFAYNFRDQARFRVNVYRQRGFVSVAMRLIPSKIRTIEELNLPSILHEFGRKAQGFFLLAGPAGHGKSTTLAALVDEINHARSDHIVTIEDPIEYLFIADRAIIDQREVGADTQSFSAALRAVFRQDPDVIMVGEMRDPETIAAALTAAETGHLVLSTLHTNNAAQTIDRIIDSFPAEQQSQVRSQLAMTLTGIVSERLIPRLSGGRIPAVEILAANPAVRNLVRERKTHEIDLVIETSIDEGMMTLNRSLANLVKQREISLENAELYSLDPKELHMFLGR
ncbi:MAG: PilT/PilU family type 4a pilus ATPase [Candidatus Terrybacteria bacterium]|nr:PilT/PilU family type 4a pilus ATPase [Candidatus Terrybacteria bacterium]